MSALKYSYHEERGEFHGYVEDEMGNVIYEMHYPEFYEDDETGELIESSTNFEDGFMENADDTEGLRKYLLSMRLINDDDEVIHESEYKSTYNDGGLTSGAYGQGTSLLEEGGEMDIEEEDKEENEIEEHLQSISDDTGIPVDVLRSYADEIGTDYMDLTNDIPYNGAFGTQEDFAEHLVDNGLITDLSNYLYMTDTDIRILAGEEADARLDGMDDEDIAEAAGMSDEYEKLKEYLDRHEELAEQIESLEDEIADMKDSFDTDDATEEDIEKFDSELKEKEDELDKLADENEPLENLEFDSLEDFIDSIKDDALSNISDEITEELEKDAVGYFENLGYSQQDLANHSLFSIDYDKLADDVSYDYIFIEGEDGDYHIFNNYADGGAIPEGYHQMPDGTIMPDSAHLEHGGDVAESNLHMLKNQAEQFEHHANELQEALKKNPRVDAWVVAKAERAATDLSDITHYLEGVNNTHSDSDGEDVIKMDVPLFIRSQEYAREDAKSDADLHEFTDNAIDLSQSGETLEMDDYKNLVPNHMAKGGVIASSSSKEGIQKLISEYYYGSKITLNKVGDAYEVSNAKGRVKGVKVVEKNGRYQFVNDIKMMARGGVNFGASFDKLKKDVLDEANAEKLLMLPKGILEEINESIDMGYDTLVEGKISPTRKGVMLIDKDYNVRGNYDLGLKGVIENILSKRKGSYAKGGGINKRGYVRAYYNDTISGGDNGHQVNLMFFRNKEDDDYFDEEFTTTNSPKEAEALAEKINKYGISGFSPKGKYSWEDKYAKGGGIEKKEYLDEYLKKIGVDKNELPARALRYHTKMANKKYENERLNDLPYKKYLVTYKIPFGAILSKVVDARTHNEAKINFRKEHGGKDVQGNVNKILKVSLTKVKKEDGGEMARGGETNKYEIYHETLSSALNEVENWAKKNGVEIRGDYFPDVKIGGINYGETKRFSIPIIKEGKKDYAKIMIQVYRMDSGRYELNMYPTYAKGGATFDDKVKAISSSLTGKEVPKRLRKDYGKKYNKKEALEAARRIAGSMRAKEMKKGKK